MRKLLLLEGNVERPQAPKKENYICIYIYIRIYHGGPGASFKIISIDTH